MNSTTFVTSFAKINDNLSLEAIHSHLKNFNTLAESGINIVLYISPEYSQMVKKYPNVRMVEYSLYSTRTFELFKNNKDKLPTHRNSEKDTFNFLLLINTKVELVYRTSIENPYGSTQFAWIDFNIFHVIKNAAIAYVYLKGIASGKLSDTGAIVIPGCWEHTNTNLHSINWRFCGGIYITDAAGALNMWERVSTLLPTLDIATWDVNVWGLLPDSLFKWYKGDHNDSIIAVPRALVKWVPLCVSALENTIRVPLILPTIPGYNSTSCSFTTFHDIRILNVRYVNYTLDPKGYYIINHEKKYLQTANILCVLDDSFKVTNAVLIQGTGLHKYSENIQGIEDLRLYKSAEDSLAFIATQREHSPNGCNRMVTGDLSLDTGAIFKARVIESPTGSGCEKNWLPIRMADVTHDYFIYSWGPYRVGYTCEGRFVFTIIDEMPAYFSRIRGSTACILHPHTGEQWTLVHFSDDNMPRNYYHMFVKLTPTGHISSWSEPFIFVREGIEYCIGMTFEPCGKRVRCWISQHDRDPLCLVFDLPNF